VGQPWLPHLYYKFKGGPHVYEGHLWNLKIFYKWTPPLKEASTRLTKFMYFGFMTLIIIVI